MIADYGKTVTIVLNFWVNIKKKYEIDHFILKIQDLDGIKVVLIGYKPKLTKNSHFRFEIGLQSFIIKLLKIDIFGRKTPKK